MLEAVDLNGDITHFRIIFIPNENDSGYELESGMLRVYNAAKFELMDIRGRKLMSSYENDASLNFLPAGMYMLLIYQGNRISRFKINIH